MAQTDNPYGLRDRQWRFVQEYLKDLNAAAAYRRAGYKCTLKAAEANSIRLIGNDRVALAIASEKAKLAAVMKLTHEQVLEEIRLLSHSTIEHYHIDDVGNVGLAPGAPPNAMRAVASLKKRITHGENGRVTYETELRLWNKPAAVRMAGEHLDLFTTQVQLPDIHVHVETARERVSSKLTLLAERHAEAARNGH